MLTGRAKVCSSSCLQTDSLSPAISSRLLRGYRSLMPSCTDFLEPRKSRLGLSKFTFNAENCMRSLSLFISIDFGAIRSCNVSCSPKSPKKFIKSPILAFGANRKPVYDFLLTTNSNLGPIWHRY